MSHPRELVEAVRRHQVIPFVGAGISMGVKPGLFPSWPQLLEGLVERMHEEASPETALAQVRQRIAQGDYLAAAEQAFQELGPYRFNRLLRERLRHRRPSGVDLSVVEALWQLRPPVILTTNYDDVLRWAREDAEPVSNDQDDELNLLDLQASPEDPRVWHLHGTIHRLATLVLAGADYKRLYGDAAQPSGYSHYTSALVRLREWIRSRPFLYLGFSFSDAYVLKQLEHVLGITRGRQVPSFALMKKGQLERGALWPKYNIQLVEYENHGAPLAESLRALARAAFGATPSPAPLSPAPLSPAPFSPPPPQAASGMRGPMPLVLSSFPADDAASTFVPGAARTGMRGPLTGPAPAPPPSPAPFVLPRTGVPEGPSGAGPSLEEESSRTLRSQHRLVLLAPEDGGARALARSIAGRYGDRVTWLEPPPVPDCTEAQYCQALVGGRHVTGFERLVEHLKERAEQLDGEHLVVLGREWGPFEHLQRLGATLRRLTEAPSLAAFHVLIAGGERSARLLHDQKPPTLFTEAPRCQVPELTVEDVRAHLASGEPAHTAWAASVHEATGGHLGLLQEALGSEGPLDAEAITARLVRGPSLRNAVHERLRQDEHEGRPEASSCRTALRELLSGRAVEALKPLEHRVEHPEVRLYFAGLVRADASGRTVLRCDAVARVAREELARLEVRP